MKKYFDKRHEKVYLIGEEEKAMKLTTKEKIDTLMKRQNMSMGEMAEKTGQSRQNLSNKMKRNNFSLSDLEGFASALGLNIEIVFTDSDGNIVL